MAASIKSTVHSGINYNKIISSLLLKNQPRAIPTKNNPSNLKIAERKVPKEVAKKNVSVPYILNGILLIATLFLTVQGIIMVKNVLMDKSKNNSGEFPSVSQESLNLPSVNQESQNLPSVNQEVPQKNPVDSEKKAQLAQQLQEMVDKLEITKDEPEKKSCFSLILKGLQSWLRLEGTKARDKFYEMKPNFVPVIKEERIRKNTTNMRHVFDQCAKCYDLHQGEDSKNFIIPLAQKWNTNFDLFVKNDQLQRTNEIALIFSDKIQYRMSEEEKLNIHEILYDETQMQDHERFEKVLQRIKELVPENHQLYHDFAETGERIKVLAKDTKKHYVDREYQRLLDEYNKQFFDCYKQFMADETNTEVLKKLFEIMPDCIYDDNKTTWNNFTNLAAMTYNTVFWLRWELDQNYVQQQPHFIYGYQIQLSKNLFSPLVKFVSK